MREILGGVGLLAMRLQDLGGREGLYKKKLNKKFGDDGLGREGVLIVLNIGVLDVLNTNTTEHWKLHCDFSARLHFGTDSGKIRCSHVLPSPKMWCVSLIGSIILCEKSSVLKSQLATTRNKYITGEVTQ